MNQAETERVMRRLKGWWNADPENQRPIPRDIWLTAEQIAAFDVLGPGKTVKSVRQYIFRHKLSDHPTWCRKAPVQGSALEYNLLLFAPKEVATRKRGKGPKEFSRPRAFAVFEAAEGGELLREMRNKVSTSNLVAYGYSVAGTVRSHCLARFGTTIMKANDPAVRIRMPSLRGFQRIVSYLVSSDLATKIDETRMRATSRLPEDAAFTSAKALGGGLDADELATDERSNMWLTVTEILAKRLPGLPATRVALQTYLDGYGLTADMLTCRKRAGANRWPEYHRSALTRAAIRARSEAPDSSEIDREALLIWVRKTRTSEPALSPSGLRAAFNRHLQEQHSDDVLPATEEFQRAVWRLSREAGEQ